MALRETIGITRLGDITGLDFAGIPVVQAVRPHSLSNSVSQGKGLTLTEAAVSAILESVESQCAERLSQFEPIMASANELNMASGLFERHLAGPAATGWREHQTTWITARNLLDGKAALVPLDLVHTAYVLSPAAGASPFLASTTGLAASFAEEDAIAHGILECIERDALARAHRTHGFFQRCRIDPLAMHSRPLRDMVESLRNKGFLLGLWRAPSPTGIPVIWCHLMEDRAPGTALLPLPAEGSAAAPEAAAAALYAILEAAQSRLAAISGARDDITRRCYPRYFDWQKIEAHRRLLRQDSWQTEPAAAVHLRAPLLTHLLAALDSCGVDAINMVELDARPLGLSVVKIVIPQLEPLVNG